MGGIGPRMYLWMWIIISRSLAVRGWFHLSSKDSQDHIIDQSSSCRVSDNGYYFMLQDGVRQKPVSLVIVLGLV